MPATEITRITPVADLGASPAMINTLSGEVLVNAPKWNAMPPEHRFFVLLHEMGHLRAGKDETRADKWAFEQYARAGYPLSESVLALSKNLTFTRPEHFRRVKAQFDRAARYDAEVNGNLAALAGNGPWESFICFTDKCRQRRNERRAKRQEERTERVSLRQEGKSERTDSRGETRQVAYQYGIDPRGYISDSVGSVANAAASIYGGGMAGALGGAGGPMGTPPPNDNRTIWIVLGGIALLVVGFLIYKNYAS